MCALQFYLRYTSYSAPVCFHEAICIPRGETQVKKKSLCCRVITVGGLPMLYTWVENSFGW